MCSVLKGTHYAVDYGPWIRAGILESAGSICGDGGGGGGGTVVLGLSWGHWGEGWMGGWVGGDWKEGGGEKWEMGKGDG